MIRISTKEGEWIGCRAIPALPTDELCPKGIIKYQSPFFIGNGNHKDGRVFLDLDLNPIHIKYLELLPEVTMEVLDA